MSSIHLLQRKPNGEIIFREPTSSNVPAYAILSHTWGKEEVIFQDIQAGMDMSKTMNKAGWRKIQFCAKQAAADGLEYFWVDTCCIDKSDPAELSRAINSMFRWYRNAKKCYVYLSDVTTAGDCTYVRTHQSTWEGAFRSSKWFTRGWTLQELIAPIVVEFFSQEHKLLGDKKSLETLIHEITQIPIQALRGNPLSDFSINERRGWSAKRQTTEEEDIVYCLLGLCGVSMPAIYGEGKDMALKRLEMTVKGFSSDSGALKNLKARSKPRRMLPFGRNKDFIGRQSQLNRLITILHTQDTEEDCQRVALVGLGGVGKTQIALECAFQLQAISPTCSVFWIRATSTTSFENAYRDIGQYLEIPGLEDANADVKKMVKTRLSQENVGKWLLIVDNADDFEMFYHNDGEDDQSSVLSEYLPFSALGAILFTTRDREAATQFAGPNVVVVDEMEDTESRELLRRNVHEKKLINDDISMKKLLALLTNLPLAVMQAAAYLNTNGCTIAEYLQIYQESNDNVIRLLSRDFQDSRRYLDMKNPVATTWLISFDQIQTRDPLAADYMAFISCIKEQDIPQSLLPPALEINKNEAIGTLKAFGFIKDRVSGTSYDMHRLVYIAMQNWLRLKKQWRNWNEKTLDRMAYMFPWPRHENRAEWLIYLPHALYVIATIKQHFNGAINLPPGLLQNLANSLSQQGKYAEAEALYRQTVKLWETVLGKDHPDTFRSINNLAISLRQQGKYAEAEALNRQTLKLQETVLGKDHPDTLVSIMGLANLLGQQGKYAEAEVLNRQTLNLWETVLGKNHPDTLISMNNLAILLHQQGKYAEAEALNRQTLKLWETILGKDHPDTLRSINNLAISLRQQGKYTEAEVLYRQTLKLQKIVLGKDHPDTLISMNNLAISLHQQGKCAEAEVLNRQTLKLQETVLGKDHPDTLRSMNNLAISLRQQGKYAEAEVLNRQTLKLWETILGKDHPDTLRSINNLAISLRQQGKYAEAEALNRQTLKLWETILGKDHPDTLISMNNLANLLRQQGKYTEAEVLYQQTLKLRETVLGKDHPDTLISMNNLANLLHQQGKYAKAEVLYQQTLKLRETVLGKDHPDTFQSINNLAISLGQQGKYAEAEALYRQMPKLQETILGKDHPDMLMSMIGLTNSLPQQGIIQKKRRLEQETPRRSVRKKKKEL